LDSEVDAVESVDPAAEAGGTIESSGVVVGTALSVDAGVLDGVEEVSDGVSNTDAEAPSTEGVEVELTKGGALVILVPLGCTA
jgi:hypothetical protein